MTTSGRTEHRERILVIRNRFIGDTVLAIPFLRNLRRHFPAGLIEVLVERGSGDVLADCPYVDRLITVELGTGRHRRLMAAIIHAVATARWLRRRRYDRVYVLKRSWSATLLARLAGIPRRTGFAGGGRRALLTRAVEMEAGIHEAEQFLSLLRADGLATDSGYNENWVGTETVTLIDSVLPARQGPRIFVAPCSTAWEKQWPLDRMAAVMRSLLEGWSADVFFCGAPDDVETHDRLRSMVGTAVAHRVHDLTSRVSLRSAAGLLSRMDLFIGVDTGLMHIAASAGVPVVAIFGPFDETRWRPWGTRHVVVRSQLGCVPCDLVRPCPINAACMRDVGVEEVLAAAGGLLGRPVP